VPEPRVVPWSEGVVHTVPSWRDRGFPTRDAQSFCFRGRGDDRFGSFGHGACDGYVESGGGMFVERSPSRDQYEFGRGRNFESQGDYRPCFPFHGARTPPVRREVISRGGHNFDRMDFANPTFEQMARHWFDSFCANPSVESVARSCSWF
jgi:hypothetical protein